MSRTATLTAVTCAVLVVLAGCDKDTSDTPTTPVSSSSTTPPPDVSEHEAGPDSPITYGFKVPKGATQIGPLARFRSAALIAAYKPELDAAIAQREAEDKDKADQAEREGTPLPSEVPKIDTPPSDDTFKPIEDPPKPDTTISLMRIDGKPTDVVRRMLAQISAAIPASEVSTTNLAKYCTAINRRITGCHLQVRGLTTDERDIQVTMTVDPGNVTTRTSPPAAQTRPIMTLMVEYVGNPRTGQLTRESNEIKNVPDVKSGGDTSGLIFPRMDEDAPSNTPLVRKWVAPKAATIILSGYNPGFVMLTTERATEGDQIAQQFVIDAGVKGQFTKDVSEDLNEVNTTYSAIAADGSTVRATNVLSARGSYTMLFSYPAPVKK
ncbi:hypothetical protein GCM10022234_23790 [Aeromicrobium panaciterrae]|uniref:hypothetical protein n=1 Tax=Aeromicrobium panaciterrae TaxID=363861 RepID=UPI0031DF0DE6